MCVPSVSVQGVGAPEEAQQLVLDGGVEAHVQAVNPQGLQLAVQNHHVHLVGRVREVAVDAHDSAPWSVGGAAAGAALGRDGHPVHLKEEEERQTTASRFSSGRSKGNVRAHVRRKHEYPEKST